MCIIFKSSVFLFIIWGIIYLPFIKPLAALVFGKSSLDDLTEVAGVVSCNEILSLGIAWASLSVYK
jgi:hypothetical protein